MQYFPLKAMKSVTKNVLAMWI